MSKLVRRIEAARAYAGISSQGQLADQIGVKRSTFKRWLTKSPDRLRPGDLTEIARITGVPRWFIKEGWEGASGKAAGAVDAAQAARSGGLAVKTAEAAARSRKSQAPSQSDKAPSAKSKKTGGG